MGTDPFDGGEATSRLHYTNCIAALGSKGIAACNGSTIEMYGKRYGGWTRLSATVNPGIPLSLIVSNFH